MACVDTRQLTQAQREAGFEQLRNAGVVQAVRPFTGTPSPENIVDYINRELFPAVKRTREKVNDVYRPVTDNAPSANPLAYFFSDETANADPTTGRLRLDAATQDTATTVRISQTNNRLKDVAAWLDVMAGSATTPLGTLTLFHATEPARFLRFDLNTMTDNGAYWDLGVSVLESSHDNPFLDGDGIVLAFIPGVAGAGATVPPSAITPIAANTVLGNPTASSAAPQAIAIGTNTVLGRVAGNIVAAAVVTDQISNDAVTTAKIANDAVTTPKLANDAVTTPKIANDAVETAKIANNAVTDPKLRDSGALSVIGRSANSTGDPADISATAASGAVLRESGSVLGFGTITLGAFPSIADDTFLANISGGSAQPTAVALTTLAGAGLTGGADAVLAVGAGSGITVNANDVQISANSAETFFGNFTASSAVPAARAGSSVAGAGLTYTAGGTLAVGAGTRITVNADDVQLAAGAAESFLGNFTSGSAVADYRAGSSVAGAGLTYTAGGTLAVGAGTGITVNADDVQLANMAEGTVKGRALAAGSGVPQDLTGTQTSALLRYDIVIDTTSTGTVQSYAPTGFSSATTGIRVSPAGALTLRGMALATGQEIVIRVGRSSALTVTLNHEDGSAAADTERFNTPNNVALVLRAGEACIIRNTESRNNVISVGRTSVADADYGDITVSGSGATWTIDNNVVSDAKLRDSGALSVIGRSANSSGDPADISAVAAGGGVLRESGSTLGFGTITLAAFPSIADDTFLANIAGSSAQPTAVALTTLAGAGLTGGADAVLAVGAGTYITVNANDVAVNRTTLSADLDSTSIVDNSGVLERAALTGDVTASQNSNATTIANDAVSNAKMANMAQSTIKGRAEGAGTGDPTDLTATQVAAIIDGEAITWTNSQNFSGAVLWTDDHVESGALPYNITIGDTVNKLFVNTAGDGEIQTIGGTTSAGRIVEVYILASGLKTIKHSTGAGSLQMPGSRDHVLGLGQSFKLIGNNPGSGWRVSDVPVEVGVDKGDLSINSTGSTWTVDNDAVSDAKLRNSAALSVIGRASNSSGDPADIAATSGGQVLRLNDGGTALSFSQVSTAGIAGNAVDDTIIRNSAGLSVIGRSANSTGDPADIVAGTAGHVLRRTGTTLGFSAVGELIGVYYGQDENGAGTTPSPPTGATWFRVTMRAGGGGGGGADADNAVLEVCAGGGGGQGGEVEFWYPVVSGSFSVVIGEGGSAGSNTGGDGGSGEDTSVTYNGETYTASGGTGGTGMSAGPTGSAAGAALGGVGGGLSASGSGHILLLTRPGADGQGGFAYAGSNAATSAALGGTGGCGGRGGVVNNASGSDAGDSHGGAGQENGGGGGGGARVATATPSTGALGGTGSDGWCRIEFYSGPEPTGSGL